MQDLDSLSKLMPNYYMWYKDLNSVYMDCNTVYAHMCSFKNRTKLYGLTDNDVPCKASELASIYQQEDKLTAESKTTQQFLTIAHYNEWKIVLTSKTPLYKGNKIIGTFGHGLDLTKIASHILQLFKQSASHTGIIQGEYTLSENFSKNLKSGFKLTRRESETLFFLVRGKTIKEIAKILRLSPRTIEQYLEQARHKFNCQSKPELVSQAIEQGFLEYIPSYLL